MLDALLASEQLPEEYRDRCQVRHMNFQLPAYMRYVPLIQTPNILKIPGYTLQ